MPSFNQVVLMGNCTRDPDLRYLPNNTPVCDIGLAVNEKYKSKQTGEMVEETHFVDCTAFGKTAENIARFFSKGRPIFICGKLRFEQWEDRQSGQKRSRLKVVVQTWQFVDSDKGGGQDQHQGGQQRSTQQAPPPPPPPPPGGSEDIPF